MTINFGDQFEPDEQGILIATIHLLKVKLKEYGGHKSTCNGGDYVFKDGHWVKGGCDCGWKQIEDHILEGNE